MHSYWKMFSFEFSDYSVCWGEHRLESTNHECRGDTLRGHWDTQDKNR